MCPDTLECRKCCCFPRSHGNRRSWHHSPNYQMHVRCELVLQPQTYSLVWSIIYALLTRYGMNYVNMEGTTKSVDTFTPYLLATQVQVISGHGSTILR